MGVLGRQGVAPVPEHDRRVRPCGRRAGGQHRAVPPDGHRAPAHRLRGDEGHDGRRHRRFLGAGTADRTVAPGPVAVVAGGRTGQGVDGRDASGRSGGHGCRPGGERWLPARPGDRRRRARRPQQAVLSVRHATATGIGLLLLGRRRVLEAERESHGRVPAHAHAARRPGGQRRGRPRPRRRVGVLERPGLGRRARYRLDGRVRGSIWSSPAARRRRARVSSSRCRPTWNRRRSPTSKPGGCACAW